LVKAKMVLSKRDEVVCAACQTKPAKAAHEPTSEPPSSKTPPLQPSVSERDSLARPRHTDVCHLFIIEELVLALGL
jgi:hypothetical protein